VATPAVEHRVNELQQALLDLVHQNDRTARSVERLSSEMREFKNEMLEFKNEMLEFKNETRKANADLRDSLNRQSAELSDAMGRLAEDILGPSIPTLFKRFFPGEEPEFAMRAVKKHKISGARREFDTPAWNDKVFLVSEAKSRLRPPDLDLLAETIAEVRNFFPEANGKKVCAALASLYIDPTLVTAGERRGFIMIALGNNLAEVMNSEGFIPAEF